MNRIIIRLCVALTALHLASCFKDEKAPVAPIPLPPDPPLSIAATDLWVYQDALTSPWINASWSASVDFASVERVYGGSRAMKISLTSAWGALSLHYGTWYSNAGISPSEYQSFTFAVYASSAGVRLSIFAENDQGQSFPKLDYGIIPQNQWVTVSLPMSQISPNGQTIHRMSIQDLSGTPVSFFADEMQFLPAVSSTPPSAPALVSPPDGATQVSMNPTFQWGSSFGAESYTLQVSTRSDFSTTVLNQAGLTGLSYTANGLEPSTAHYWRVNASNAAGTSPWSSASQFTTRAASPEAPDLTIDADRLQRSYRIGWKSFSAGSCAVVENCASPGSRKLLRFDVVVPNFGNADLVMGDPGHPDNGDDFVWSPCHGHYHYDGFAEYRLLNQNGVLVRGHKQAFCLMDSQRYWSGSPSRGFDCHNQGISVGWADVYDRSIDCQWIDITGVSPGSYILEVEVNANGKIDEGSNEWPNIARASITIR